jgi:hypothetical protein
MARMKTYQRILYVGLGGTGLSIGMQLEQALRGELCGSNGRALIDELGMQGLEPYQLPGSIQFVYFDFDEADRGAARSAGMARASETAAAANAQVVANISPPQHSYQKVAESLRIDAREAVREWLPDRQGEPQIAPLKRGAGQMPTVGRAALFESFRAAQGPTSVTNALSRAFARLSEAGGDLSAVSGGNALDGYDVFVGFSVAGGTGAGLFYDVLRLIGQVAEDAGFVDEENENTLSIFPLVVMPSAFESEFPKDKRSHMLNGGPALKELFELVDANYSGADPPSIEYPGGFSAHALVPTKTAFLFSKPATLTRDDLHRSIVAFVLSAIGTTIQGEQGAGFKPLTSSLINDTRFIGAPAPDGIGLHPAATALAAELRIPLEEIVEILSQHVLSNATRELQRLEPAEEAENLGLFNVFGNASKLDALADPKSPGKLPVVNAQGAKEITAQLTRRARAAEGLLSKLRASLQTSLARLASDYDYEAGLKALADQTDLFRMQRVILGDPRFTDPRVRDGFRAAVARFGQVPPPNPNEFTDAPPPVPALADAFKGMKKLTVSDSTVRATIRRQDVWFDWRVAMEYHRVWGSYQETWEPRLRQMQERLRAMITAFDDQAANEPNEFGARCQGLYRKRTGVVYFVPDGGARGDLENWYTTAVLPRLCEVLGLPEGSDEGKIVRRIMFGQWRDAYESVRLGSTSEPRDYVLALIRKRLTEDVLATGDSTSLLPRIETLLREAAQQSPQGQAAVPERLLEIFRRSLQDLLPADFRPKGRADEGTGQLKIDVFYPSPQNDPRIENFLAQTALRSIAGAARNSHAVSGVDFLSVLLRRESLPAMAVDEYRALMEVRADGLRSVRATDYLAWRQRLQFDRNWLVLRREERIRVLGALLTALYDGSIRVLEGTKEDPSVLEIYQEDEGAGQPIELPLRADTHGISRWCDLVSAYERYALSGDQQALARCKALLARRSPAHKDRPPDELYEVFQAVRTTERAKAATLWNEMRRNASEASKPAMPLAYEFWEKLLPAADDWNKQDPDWLALSLNLGDSARGPSSDALPSQTGR